MHKGDIYLKLVGLSFVVEQTLFFIELAHVVNINNVRFTMRLIRLIRLKEVMHLTGLGRSSIYKFMAGGGFPMSISLSERAVAWDANEIEEWMLEKVESRNNAISGLVNVEAEMVVSEVDVIKFINSKFKHLNISDAIAWLMHIYQ